MQLNYQNLNPLGSLEGEGEAWQVHGVLFLLHFNFNLSFATEKELPCQSMLSQVA